MADNNTNPVLAEYIRATDHLIAVVQQEQKRAESGQSMVAMEDWDRGWFDVQDAVTSAKKARDSYQNELREKNYNF